MNKFWRHNRDGVCLVSGKKDKGSLLPVSDELQSIRIGLVGELLSEKDASIQILIFLSRL